MTIPSRCPKTVLTRAVEQEGVDLILRRLGEAVSQSVAGGEASPQPCHHAVMDALFVH